MRTRWRRVFSPFEARGYRYIAASTFFFGASWTMDALVQGWVVLQLTDSPFWVGAAAGIRGTSQLLFSVAGGTFADRFDRRRVLLATYLFLASVAAALGVLAAMERLALWNLIPLVVLGGAVGLVGPSSSAMVHDVVGSPRLLNASAFSFLNGAIVRTLTGVAGGLSLDRLGVAPTYFIVAGLFMATAAALVPLRLRRETGSDGPREASIAALRAGLAYARRTPAVRELLALSAITEVFGFAYLFVLPVLARDVLSVSATGLGALTSAIAAGQFLAMASLGMVGDVRRKDLLLIASTLAFGLSVVTLSLSSMFVLSLAIVFAVGAAASLYDSSMWTAVQMTASAEMRGRVLGLYMATYGLSQIGGFIVGAAATLVTLPVALGVAGAVVAVNAVRSLRLGDRVKRGPGDSEIDTPPQPAVGS
ncbi:MAG TPA: MFS transporter [Candidatus Limnocylindrales bacterium]|nr:MFS transporter [Candidatus Limnocylindrales bacterium]